MLTIKELETGYNKKQVIFGVSMRVDEGEILALIGPNGSGKSTVLKTISGLVQTWSGEIQFNDSRIDGIDSAQIVEHGISFVPQGGRVFQDLTVMENLKIGGFQIPRKAVKKRVEQVLESFPLLKGRLGQDAGRLSGGEQQMLALSRALMSQPKLLLLDEPTLGLSPNLASSVLEKVIELNHRNGISILIVEHKVREVFEACSRVVAMKRGKVTFEGSPDVLKSDVARLKELFL